MNFNFSRICVIWVNRVQNESRYGECATYLRNVPTQVDRLREQKHNCSDGIQLYLSTVVVYFDSLSSLK
jgi:hypothetical protein